MVRPDSLARLVALSVLAGLAGCAGPQQQSAYVERLGNDTLAVEVFARTRSHIEGRVLMRSPVTRVIRYDAALDPQGKITSLEAEISTPAQNPRGRPPQRAKVTIKGDSAVGEVMASDTMRFTIPIRDVTIPMVFKTPYPIAFIEQAVRRAQASGKDTFAFNILPVGSRRAQANVIVKGDSGWVAMDFFGLPLDVRVDDAGHVLALDGGRTTVKVHTEAVDPKTVDLDALAADFAARDAAGRGLGALSSRDTLAVSGGGADFWVDYGRPAKRGRDIWSKLVPFDTVWRTGADAATQFRTSRDLMVGSARVPAGMYTLWSLYGPTSAELIINKQTGQWGTEYDSTQDLVRVPMSPHELSEPVERFTIAIDSTADGGTLKLMWDRTEFSVPLKTVRR
jgi:hypothetical protein